MQRLRMSDESLNILPYLSECLGIRKNWVRQHEATFDLSEV